MMISVSTTFCSASTPSSACRIRFAPSNWKGFVTTPTVRTPSSRAACAMIGAAPVPVPPPMPAVMKHICAPARWSTICSIDSSAAAAPTVGRAPAPRPSVTRSPIWMVALARLCISACASVLATTNSTPSRFLSIMLLTALPPAPPTPKTVMRGFSSSRPVFITKLSAIASPPVFVAPVASFGYLFRHPIRVIPRLSAILPTDGRQVTKKTRTAHKIWAPAQSFQRYFAVGP